MIGKISDLFRGAIARRQLELGHFFLWEKRL